jgi:hypothetical protein
MEDAILHGCIPVIIQDNVHLPFETILDYDSFSVRIDEGAASHLPHILKAIPKHTVATMQVRVWCGPGRGRQLARCSGILQA